MKKNTKLLSLTSMPATLVVAALMYSPQNALACGTDAYIGEVCVTAASFCPKDTLEAVGTTLAITQYQSLYSLLGCNYGGDCRSTFSLPDLRGRAPVHYGTGPGLAGHAVAQKYGVETIVQQASQLAIHTHSATLMPSSGAGGTASGTVTLPVTGSAKIATSSTVAGSITPSDRAVLGKSVNGLSGTTIYAPSSTSADLNIGPEGAVTGVATGPVTLDVTGGSGGTIAVGQTGASAPMVVVGPRLAMRYCVVTDGIYPPRP